MVVRKYLPLSQRRYLAIKETYNERNQLHFTKESSREEKEKTRGTDNARFHSGRNPTRHRCSPSRAEEIVSNVRDSFAAIHHPQSRNVSFPRIWPFHQGSLVDALFATTTRACVCVCVFVSSIVLFVTYRFTYDRISSAWVVEPARIVFLEKALPFLRCYFLFAPSSQSTKRGN